VLEDDGLALAHIDHGHAPTLDVDKPLLGIGLGARGRGGGWHFVFCGLLVGARAPHVFAGGLSGARGAAQGGTTSGVFRLRSRPN